MLRRIANFAASGRDLYIDDYLSNVALDYRQQAEYIADMIFPTVDVPKQSGYYPDFSRPDAYRVPADTRRAPGEEAKIITRSVGSGQFYCDNYALKVAVTVEDKANMNPIMLQKLYNGRSIFVTDKLMLDREVRVANMVTSGTNVGSYAAVNSVWSDLTNANPLLNIWTAMDNVADSTGHRVNRLTFGEQAWREFRRNANVRNLILGRDGSGLVTRQQVANLFEVEEVLVGGAYKNTGNEAQAETLSQIWSENVLISYSPRAPSMDEPAFGYTFNWQVPEVPAMQVERHPYDSRRKSEELEVGYYSDERIVGASYGFLLTT